MGMFDEVKCNMLLPDGRMPAESWFQTKCLYNCMEQFTITEEGRLIFHKREYETDGEWEVRPGIKLPKYKLVQEEELDMGYHGDISMCGVKKDGPLVEYAVRFTHGIVEWIRPLDTLSDIHQSWLYARN